MKRLALVALIIVAFAASASAQGMQAGLKGGLNIAKATGDDVPDEAAWLYSGIGGAFLCYMFNDMFAIQPELLFAMKGWKIEVEDETFKTKLNYIEIPLLLRLNIPTEGSMTPAIFAGPSIGFLMSAKAEDEDIKELLKSTDFGLVFGAGLNHELSEDKGFITYEVRYSLGLATVFDLEEVDEQPDVKNMGISIMVGYGKSF